VAAGRGGKEAIEETFGAHEDSEESSIDPGFSWWESDEGVG
jgi:hypothetical protein